MAEVDRTASRTERLHALLQAGLAVASGLDLDDVLVRVVESARTVTDARYSALGVLDDTGSELARFITSGIDDERRRAIGDLPRGRGILGVLIRDATPLRLANIADDPRSVGFPPNHPPMSSFLGVPVMAGGSVFGNLYLTERIGGGEFTEADEQVATLLAAQAGVAIQNARLYAQMNDHAEALRKALGDLSSASAINEAILSGRPREEVLTVIAQRAADSLGVRLVAVAVAGSQDQAATFVAAAGDGAESVVGTAVDPHSTTGTVLFARRPVLIEEAVAGDELGARTGAFVPLLHRGDAIGVIAAADPHGGRFDDDDLGVLTLFAARAVLAVEFSRALAGERRRVEAEARLAEAENRGQARREMIARIVEAQEAERGRIARELHDEFGQHLASILLGLRLVEQAGVADDAKGALAELVETINAAIAKLRALAIDLRPTALDDFGLLPALERLTESYERRTGIATTLRFDAPGLRLPSQAETAIYRVVQESLTNAAKHANARSIVVRGESSDDEVIVKVVDDGAGFDPAEIEGGFGLVSMQERASLVSGSVRVSSARGSGTTIELRVPR